MRWHITLGKFCTYYVAGRWVAKWGNRILAYYIAGNLRIGGRRYVGTMMDEVDPLP